MQCGITKAVQIKSGSCNAENQTVLSGIAGTTSQNLIKPFIGLIEYLVKNNAAGIDTGFCANFGTDDSVNAVIGFVENLL